MSMSKQEHQDESRPLEVPPSLSVYFLGPKSPIGREWPVNQ